MSARLIIHIILTIVLFALGWWLYASIGNANALDSITVAKYWFAILVYVLTSWIFYWAVHRLKLKVWLIMQVLAILISAAATIFLVHHSQQYQQRIEEQAIQEQKDEEAPSAGAGQDTTTVIEPESTIDTLNLSEEGELDDSENAVPEVGAE